MTTPPTCEDCGKLSTVFRPYAGTAPDIFLCTECKDKRGWRENFYPVADHPNNPDNECPADYHHDSRY